MKVSRLDIAAILCLLAAAWLHQDFCEWRLRRYPIRGERASEARLLVSLRSRDHLDGNAARWDAAAVLNRAQTRAWLQCYDGVHGPPAPQENLARLACFAELRFGVHDAATRSVALGECEYARFGRVRRQDEIGSCLAKRGLDAGALPRWTSDTHGRRFGEAYRERFGLWAETVGDSAADDRRRALLWGLALPSLLTGVGCAAALLRRLPAAGRRSA